jgi:hypothetical protein
VCRPRDFSAQQLQGSTVSADEWKRHKKPLVEDFCERCRRKFKYDQDAVDALRQCPHCTERKYDFGTGEFKSADHFTSKPTQHR